MTQIPKIVSSFFQNLRNPWFWLALVFGVSFNTVLYQEVYLKFWAPGTNRMKVVGVIVFLLLSAVFVWLIEHLIKPYFIRLSLAQKIGIISISILIPVILLISIFHPQKIFAEKVVYGLLPERIVQIDIPGSSLQGSEDVRLILFRTQIAGDLSYNALDTVGWERRDYLYLTDPDNNRIIWRGKPGYTATLVFAPRSSPAEVRINWDGNETILKLNSSNGEHEIIAIQQFTIPLYAGWLPVVISYILSAAFFVSVLLLKFLTYPGLVEDDRAQKRDWLLYAIPLYAIWFFYLAVFWPGIMSADSVSQWEQMVTGQYVNWHPVAHTLTMWLITRAWYSPAAIAIVQILALGAVLGWGAAALDSHGAPKWLTWGTILFLGILPANATLSITIWKDILFATTVVALTIQVFEIVVTHGAWLEHKRNWLFLGLVLLLVSLYRQNGFFVAIGSLLVLVLVYKKYWRAYLKAAILFLTIFLFITGPVFKILNVEKSEKARYQVVLANLLSAHMFAGSPISVQERALLQPAFPAYPWPYNCDRNLGFVTTPNLDRRYLVNHTREILDLAIQLTIQYPQVALDHFACQGAFVFRIPEEGGLSSQRGYFSVIENQFGLKESSLIPSLKPSLLQLLYLLNDSLIFATFFWRAPLWMVLCVFGCFVFCVRNKTIQPLLVLLPGLLTALPYIVLSLGQIFRYVYPMYLVGILFSGYFWLCVMNKRTE